MVKTGSLALSVKGESVMGTIVDCGWLIEPLYVATSLRAPEPECCVCGYDL